MHVCEYQTCESLLAGLRPMACVWVYVTEHVLRCLCSPGYSHVQVCTRLHMCPWADGLAHGEDAGFHKDASSACLRAYD